MALECMFLIQPLAAIIQCYVMLCYVMTNRTERTLSVMLVNGEMTVNIVHILTVIAMN